MSEVNLSHQTYSSPPQTMIGLLSPDIIFTFTTNLPPLQTIYHSPQSVPPVTNIWARAVSPIADLITMPPPAAKGRSVLIIT